MTTPAAARRSSNLWLRILSALVLIPPALAAVWFGPPWIAIIAALGGLAMGWEWGRLTAARPRGPREIVVTVTVVAATGLAAFGWTPWALAIAAGGGAAAALSQGGERGWTLLGTVWIAGACIAFLWFAAPERGGRLGVILLLSVVWATDIFAYFVGKAVGGPRLAPQLSPNKTWAGFFGGLAGSAIVALVAARWAGAPWGQILVVSLGLSLCAQGGDLAESWAKRHFAVKDTSALIPGHGGVLDRLDALLAAAIAAALLTLAMGTTALSIR